MCISNRVGPPVEGEDFFGRDKGMGLPAAARKRNIGTSNRICGATFS